jgi:hypothetical protein
MADFNNISTVSTLNSAGRSVFASVEMQSISPTITSTSLSGRVQAKSIGAQQFAFRGTLVPMTHTEFKPIYSFLVSKRGKFSTFTINLPIPHEGTFTSGTASGTIGQSTISVTGTGTLKAGDFVGFNNSSHSKAYMVTADVTIGTGTTVNITPPLHATESAQTLHTGGAVDFKVRQKTDTQGYAVGVESMYNTEIDIEEAV